ncbi:replication terminator protein [Lysinibacillus sp. FJAT-14745]|uniref:replication terminator protein n=1 Tax=Lysinibacillus sp. FJAT-14745 TaxID=1704289 RepID=UPI0006BF91BC|nr:replication terminator protein [Lysinibacillus sp. FJAT-14745]KOP78637.1 replication terminator protein [Lysinibacillus sp. FJAT-14745]
MQNQMINLDNFAGGAVTEKLNAELQKVLANIADPNTDHKKARKVSMTMTLKANESRGLATVTVDVKSTLAPSKGVETQMMIDFDSKGNVVGAELKSGIPGQTYFDGDGVKTDTGEPVEKVENAQPLKVVQFK